MILVDINWYLGDSISHYVFLQEPTVDNEPFMRTRRSLIKTPIKGIIFTIFNIYKALNIPQQGK